MVSGDVHSSWAFEGPRDDDGRPVAVELVCPSVTSTPMARQLPSGWERLADRLADAADGARWSDLRAWGWLRLSITPERVTGEWWGVAPEAPAVERQLLAAWSTTPSLPARLREADGPLADLPARPGPPIEALPPRPEGLGRRGGAHRLLVAAASAGVAAAVGLGVAAWWWRRRAAGLPEVLDAALDRLPAPPGR